jgi:hypothetical protein
MNQENKNDISDVESLEIVKKYLRQLNGVNDEPESNSATEQVNTEPETSSATEQVNTEPESNSATEQVNTEPEKLQKITNNINDNNKQIQLPPYVMSTDPRFMHKIIKAKNEDTTNRIDRSNKNVTESVNSQNVIESANSLNINNNVISTTKVSKGNIILLTNYRR